MKEIMPKKPILAALLALGAALAMLAALTSTPATAQSEATSAEASAEAMAQRYFQQLTDADYTGWAFEPGVPDGFYVGAEPHGMILRVFVNEIAMNDLASGADAFSEGAILVKENHAPGAVDVAGMAAQAPVADFEGDLAALTYMVKVPGYNRDAGDWFWAKQQPDGTIDAAGAPAGCVGCHAQVADNDWVFNAVLGGF